MNKPLRVVHFVSKFSLPTETFIYDYIIEAERQGIDGYVVALERENEQQTPFDKVNLLSLPPRYHPLRWGHKLKGLVSSVAQDETYDAYFRPKLLAALELIAPDVVHAQFGPAGVLIAPVCQTLAIPLVVSFHGYDATKLTQQGVWRNRFAELFSIADSVIAVSQANCEALACVEREKAKLRLIHYGTDLQKFGYIDPPARTDGGHVRCVNIGRLVPKKNPLGLIDAFHQAVQDMQPQPTASLSIVGDGPLRAAAEARICELQAQSYIRILGSRAHDQIPRLLAQSQLYLQHSVRADDGDQEGLPVALIEAAACGLPIVSTRHSGIPEIVLDGVTGYLVEEHDVQGMAARIRALCEAPKTMRAFGESARRHAIEHFSREMQVSKVLDVLQEAVVARPLTAV